VIFSILLCGYLGGMGIPTSPAAAGKLLTIEEVGSILNGISSPPHKNPFSNVCQSL